MSAKNEPETPAETEEAAVVETTEAAEGTTEDEVAADA